MSVPGCMDQAKGANLGPKTWGADLIPSPDRRRASVQIPGSCVVFVGEPNVILWQVVGLAGA